MASNRKISVLIDENTPMQAIRELQARYAALGTWDKVSFSVNKGEFLTPYIWQVAMDKRKPSRRLLLALGIVKPEKRTGIRVRMSEAEAREIVDRGTVPVNVVNRIGYALWGVK